MDSRFWSWTQIMRISMTFRLGSRCVVYTTEVICHRDPSVGVGGGELDWVEYRSERFHSSSQMLLRYKSPFYRIFGNITTSSTSTEKSLLFSLAKKRVP